MGFLVAGLIGAVTSSLLPVTQLIGKFLNVVYEQNEDIDEDLDFDFLAIEEFETDSRWLEAIKQCLPDAYVEIEKKYLNEAQVLEPEHIVFMSFLSRARGVHEAIVNEIEFQNPHGTFPLIRVFTEIACTLFYAIQKNDFVGTLFGSDGTRSGIPKFVVILDSVETSLPHSRAIYTQLSEYTHFKGIGIFNNFNMAISHDKPQLLWTSRPRFRSDKDFKTACALTKYLFRFTEIALEQYGNTYLH